MQNFKWVLLAMVLMIACGQAGAIAADGTSVEKEFTYNDHDKRDPFWSLLGNRGTILNFDKDIYASDMVLEGVLLEPTGDSVAIINGNIVKIGDKVGFFIVKEIQVNMVILEKGQEIITLKLKKEE
ncbi:MAG: hypothetical protein H6753_02030 [Candidatus Omnitrophica bacterium]|nr:hypothetical protein [Candidatus Omnitrophota bacterium]